MSHLAVEAASSAPTSAPAFISCSHQPWLHSAGGDYGPDVFQWVWLPSAEHAAHVASRCALVRACFEVWGCAFWDREAAVSEEDAGERAAERWQLLADAVQSAEGPEATTMLAPIGDASWRVDIDSVGWKKPRSLGSKVALMEKFDELLWQLPGPVELHAPRAVVGMVEDCRGEDADGADRARVPCRLFMGRRLAVGAGKELSTLALSSRPYLGRTTLPPALALIMANHVRALVLSPRMHVSFLAGVRALRLRSPTRLPPWRSPASPLPSLPAPQPPRSPASPLSHATPR